MKAAAVLPALLIPAVSSAECDCACANWLEQVSTCASQCEADWRRASCGPYAAGLDAIDAETGRYQAAVRQLGVVRNVEESWVYVFSLSPPEVRAAMWEDLEVYREQTASDKVSAALREGQKEQVGKAERESRYDAETSRYQAALQAAGYPAAESAGLTAAFAPSTPAIRQVYWNSIGKRDPED